MPLAFTRAVLQVRAKALRSSGSSYNGQQSLRVGEEDGLSITCSRISSMISRGIWRIIFGSIRLRSVRPGPQALCEVSMEGKSPQLKIDTVCWRSG